MGNRRKALITGSSRGIGAAIAKRLALDGVEIVFHGNQNPAAAETVVKEITDRGGKATFVNPRHAGIRALVPLACREGLYGAIVGRDRRPDVSDVAQWFRELAERAEARDQSKKYSGAKIALTSFCLP